MKKFISLLLVVIVVEQFIIGIPEKPDSCRLLQLLTTTAPLSRSQRFFRGEMPTFPPMIYVDYISHFFNLFWDRDELADAVLVMVFVIS